MKLYIPPVVTLLLILLIPGKGATYAIEDARNLSIWEPPLFGFSEESRGRTAAELDMHEALTGFRLPALYREHMKKQNGGDVRFRAYQQKDFSDVLFLGGEEMAPLEESRSTLRDHLENHLDAPEEASTLGEHPDRLFILSYMDWHRVLCLDYGLKSMDAFSEPQVILLNMEDLTEDFRAASYDAFVSGLQYYTDEGEPEVLYSLYPREKGETLRETAALLGKEWEVDFLLMNDGERYAGHAPWYVAREKRGGTVFTILVQENRYLAGTKPFPECDAPFILSFAWAERTPEACYLFAEEYVKKLEKTHLATRFLLMSGSGVDRMPPQNR